MFRLPLTRIRKSFLRGDYADVSVTLDAERAAPTQTIVLDVNFILTNLDADPYIETVQTKTVTLNVTSLIASTGNNIFFWENTLPAPFNTAIWTFILTIGIWALITAAVVIVIDPILKYFFGKSKLSFISKIYKLVKKPVFLTVLIYGLVNSLTILSVSADTILVIKDGLVVFFIALYAWVAYKVYNDVIIDYARRLASKTETELDDALVPFLHTLGVIAIPLVAFIAILNYFNISFTAILAGLGVGSLVIGLAAQDTFSSIFAGIQIMVDRPFKVGDRIILSTGQVCDVKKIGIRSTRAYGVTNHEMIVIPNVLLCNNKVTNISRPDGHRAISVEVGVAYGTDIEKAERFSCRLPPTIPMWSKTTRLRHHTPGSRSLTTVRLNLPYGSMLTITPKNGGSAQNCGNRLIKGLVKQASRFRCRRRSLLSSILHGRPRAASKTMPVNCNLQNN